VIPAAGMGTRLLSVTKEQPKEMLPVFAKAMNGDLCLKPIVQLIFEQLYSVGFRDFCFIVGREKRAIEDHFTPDLSFISKLDSKGLDSTTGELQAFYKMIDDSTLVWINQPAPRGFGDAVLKAKGFAGNDRFLVHAGDSYFISKNAEHLRRLVRISEESRRKARQAGLKTGDYACLCVRPGYFQSIRVDEDRVRRRTPTHRRHPENCRLEPERVYNQS